MCEPATLITIGTYAGYAAVAGGLAAGTASAVQEQKAAEERKKAADKALSFATAESAKITRDEAEATAEESFELARTAAVNRGLAQNSGLGVTSVRALSQAVGFQLGQDKATLEKNMRTANADQRARIDAANMQRESEYGQAGDTTGLRLGLQIGGSLITAAVGAGAVNAAAQAAQAGQTAATLAQSGTASASAIQAANASAQALSVSANAWGASSGALQIATSTIDTSMKSAAS